MSSIIKSVTSRNRSLSEELSEQDSENLTSSFLNASEEELRSQRNLYYRSFEEQDDSESLGDSEMEESIDSVFNKFNEKIYDIPEDYKADVDELISGLRVFSYYQRKTTELTNLFSSTFYTGIVENIFDDISSISTTYFNFVDKESFLRETKINLDEFFNLINDLDEITTLNYQVEKDLNFANIVKDFFKTKRSNLFGNIISKSNENLRSLVKNRDIVYVDNFRIKIDQDFEKNVENISILENDIFRKNFLCIDSEFNSSLSNENANNNFIFNTDKLVSQIHINYFASEKLISPNTFDLAIFPETLKILSLEDYPIVQIGKRLYNNNNILNHVNNSGSINFKSLKSDSSIINSAVGLGIKRHSSLYSKFKAYTSGEDPYALDKIYYNTFYDRSETLEYEEDISRINQVDLSNVFFITECAIKYGNSTSLLDRDIMTGDIDNISGNQSILPLGYFYESGSYFNEKSYQDFLVTQDSQGDNSFDTVYLSLHNPQQSQEVDQQSPLYFSKRRLPFTVNGIERYSINPNEGSLNREIRDQQLIDNAVENNNNLIKKIIGLDRSLSENNYTINYSQRGVNTSSYNDPRDFLNIDLNSNSDNNTWSYNFNYDSNRQNQTSNVNIFDLGNIRRNRQWIVDYINQQQVINGLNNNISPRGSYLHNIVLFVEKINRVIETYLIYGNPALESSYLSSTSSVDNNDQSIITTSERFRSIKSGLKNISINIMELINKEKEIIDKLSISSRPELINIYSNLLDKYNLGYVKILNLVKRLHGRFIKESDLTNYYQNLDQSTGMHAKSGDFNLGNLIFDISTIEESNKLYEFQRIHRDSSVRNIVQDWIEMYEILEETPSGTSYNFKNRIDHQDINEEGDDISFILRGSSRRVTGTGATPNQQFYWRYNSFTGQRSFYPRFYDYIYMSINSILNGTINNNGNFFGSTLSDDFFRIMTAGQFKDIQRQDSISEIVNNLKIETEAAFSRAREDVSEVLHDIYTNVNVMPVNCLLDVHMYKYNNTINKTLSNSLRRNFLEAGKNTLDENTFKLQFVNTLNKIKKHKLSSKDIDINNILPLGKKLYERSVFLSKENKDLAFAYGNNDSSNILLTSSDEETSTFIQENIFTNNYKKNISMNGENVKTTHELFRKNIALKGNFKNQKEDLLNMCSYYYSDNMFKNNKTIYFSLLKDVIDYANKHKRNWDRPINNIDKRQVDFWESHDDPDTNPNIHKSLYDVENKKYFLNFQYDSYLCKVFSRSNKQSSIEFIKRLIAYCITSQTEFSSYLNISEVDIDEDPSSKRVFKENLSSIIDIDKKNRKNSKEINNFLFSKENAANIRKYSILKYTNFRQTFFNSDPGSSTIPSISTTNTPLDIFSYRNFSQSGISNYRNYFKVRNKFINTSTVNEFTKLFVENPGNIYKNASASSINSIESSTGSYYLNIPTINDVEVIKEVSVKKLYENNENLLDINGTNIQEEDKNNDLVYKFRTCVKDKLWIAKSNLETTRTGIYENPIENNNFDEEGKANITLDDYSFDIPSQDLFYYSINSKDISMLSLINKNIVRLLKYFEVDISQFNNYDEILDFVEDNNFLIDPIFNFVKTSAKMFEILHDRYQSYSVYNMCAILSDNDYTEGGSLGVRQRRMNEFTKQKKGDINNIIQTFRHLTFIISDISRIYTYFIDESVYDHRLNDLEGNVLTVEKSFENFMIGINDIGFDSKDTDVLIDLLNTCNINDISKSIYIDIIKGYYKTLENTSKNIESNRKKTDTVNKKIKNYFISENYSFESCINNEIYLNMLSKKLQNIYVNKRHVLNRFVNSNNPLIEKFSDNRFYQKSKELKISEKEMLKYLYNNINNSISTRNPNYLINKSFDFIKIGIPFEMIQNISLKSMLKFTIYSIDHNTLDIDLSEIEEEQRLNIKTFYYSPILTSIPAAYYDEIKDSNKLYVGFYDVNERITNRFKLYDRESLTNNFKLFFNTSITNNSYNNESYPIDYDNLGNKLFTDAYFSMFAEYYEKLINNITSENTFEENQNISEGIIDPDFYKSILSIKNTSFINIFDIEKKDLSKEKTGIFNLLNNKDTQIELQSKTDLFLQNTSSNKTNIDLYKAISPNKYYDFFNIIVDSPLNKNVTYALKVEII